MENKLLEVMGESFGVGMFAMSVVGALRARMPKLDGGAVVLSVTALVVAIICVLLKFPADRGQLLETGQVALFAWFAAIGVPAVASRVAGAAADSKSDHTT